MAKFNEREGNSCHIHLSVRGRTPATPVMAGDGEHGFSPLMGHWIAGILATLREFTLLYAPTINSYKRFAKGTFAPDGGRLGPRQPHLRAARDRPRLSRCASRTACPAATSTRTSRIVGDHRRRPARHRERAAAARPARRQRVRVGRRPPADHAARGGAALRASPTIARAAFGDDMVEHYLNQARIEVEAYDAAVTDWERVRGFERL